MTKIDKDFFKIPSVLQDIKVQKSFDANVKKKSYCDNNNRYKVIKKDLEKLYHLKCVYCEKKLLDSFRHIEHYRPKSTYFWLAYSWDNLFLCCEYCNTSKRIKFDIGGDEISFSSEKFNTIHNLCDMYDKTEKPKIINPEKEDVFKELIFNADGKISSNNTRITYTVEDVCKLNRSELQKLRIKDINDFINRIQEHYLYYKKQKDKKDFSRFEPDVKQFIKDADKINEFYSIKRYFVDNVEKLFSDRLLSSIILLVKERIVRCS